VLQPMPWRINRLRRSNPAAPHPSLHRGNDRAIFEVNEGFEVKEGEQSSFNPEPPSPR
jgi:hypothetical protein